MNQGLQCWDSSGKLVVDIGDYNLKYHGSLVTRWAVAQKKQFVPVSGMKRDGWIVVPAYGDRSPRPYNLATTVEDGGFTAIRLSDLGGSGEEYTVNIYRYI